MADGTIAVRMADPKIFSDTFGEGVEYAIGMGQNGGEIVLVCPEGTDWQQQGLPDTDITALFAITSTTYVKCDSSNRRWCCSGNICVRCGSC